MNTMKLKLSYLSAIISLILISNTSSFCQLVQASNFLSASLNFDTQKNESAVHDHINNKTKALNIYSSISWGHYINQKWAVGLTAGIEYNLFCLSNSSSCNA